MNNLSSLEISDIEDEYTEVTQADLDRAVFGLILSLQCVSNLLRLI